MKEIVKSRFRAGEAMRKILRRLELAVNAMSPINAVKAMSPINNEKKRQKQISDKKRALEMLEKLPKELGVYFEKNNISYLSEEGTMAALKHDLDALLVNGEMLLTQLQIINSNNITINFSDQSKKESKEAKKESDKKLEAYEKDSGRKTDTLDVVVTQAKSTQDGMSNQSTALIIKDKQIEEKDKQIEEKDQQLGEKDQKLEEKDQKLEEKDQKLEEKDQKLEEKDQKLQEKDNVISEKDEIIAKSNEESTKAKEIIAALQAQLAAFTAANTKSSQQTGSLLTDNNRVNRYALANPRDEGSDIDEDAVCIDASVNNAI